MWRTTCKLALLSQISFSLFLSVSLDTLSLFVSLSLDISQGKHSHSLYLSLPPSQKHSLSVGIPISVIHSFSLYLSKALSPSHKHTVSRYISGIHNSLSLFFKGYLSPSLYIYIYISIYLSKTLSLSLSKTHTPYPSH